MSEVAPGWYRDPVEPTTQRYWDGEGWVGAALPSDATPPPGPPPEPEPEPEPPAPSELPPGGMPWPPGGAPSSAPPPGRPGGRVPRGYPYSLGPGPPERPHGRPLAPLGIRLAARLIDIAAVVGLNVLANGYPVYLWWQEIGPYLREAVSRAMAGDTSGEGLPAVGDNATALQILIMVVGMAMWFLYEVPAVANTGQTPGKRLLGLKVVALESPNRLGYGRSFRRWNTMALPALLWWCGVGFILQLIDAVFILIDQRRRMALHDRSAFTAVVLDRSAGGTAAPGDPGVERKIRGPADPS